MHRRRSDRSRLPSYVPRRHLTGVIPESHRSPPRIPGTGLRRHCTRQFSRRYVTARAALPRAYTNFRYWQRRLARSCSDWNSRRNPCGLTYICVRGRISSGFRSRGPRMWAEIYWLRTKWALIAERPPSPSQQSRSALPMVTRTSRPRRLPSPGQLEVGYWRLRRWVCRNLCRASPDSPISRGFLSPFEPCRVYYRTIHETNPRAAVATPATRHRTPAVFSIRLQHLRRPWITS